MPVTLIRLIDLGRCPCTRHAHALPRWAPAILSDMFGPVRIDFCSARIDSGDGAALAAAMRAEVAEICGGIDPADPKMPAAGPREFGPPHGLFLVGYHDGLPVCCGGIKRLDERACELKRMYVALSARGTGIAHTLLAELERRARGLGYEVARLDTDARLRAAEHLYRSAGYRQIANFNGNPVATFFGEKPLTTDSRCVS